jgi:hypothetical protein
MTSQSSAQVNALNNKASCFLSINSTCSVCDDDTLVEGDDSGSNAYTGLKKTKSIESEQDKSKHKRKLE